MKLNKLAAAAALAAVYATGAQAAIDCGNATISCQSVSLNGVTVTYDENTLNPSGLYDAPVLSDDGAGNVIVDLRATSNFFAEANATTTSDSTSGIAFLDITTGLNTNTNQMVAVEELFIFEGGNYATTGAGFVSQTGYLDVTDNNSGVSNAGTGQDSYSAGMFQGNGNWSVLGNTNVYTSGSVFGGKTAGSSDDVSVQINNILQADATSGGTAFIRKNTSQGFVRLGVNTNPPPAPAVPVPAAAWLFGSALMGLFARKKLAA